MKDKDKENKPDKERYKNIFAVLKNKIVMKIKGKLFT